VSRRARRRLTAEPPPLVVLDVADLADLEEAARRLARNGWTVVDGLEDPPLGDGVVCRALVEDEERAAAAVLAATWGAGLLIGTGGATADVRERLLDDLRRIGPVSRRLPPEGPALDPEAAELLGLLEAGSTLGSAARTLHLSRRTADRRLADARRQLGVETTVEAITRWRALTR